MKSLQNKIFFFFVGLLLLVQIIVFYSNFRATVEQEKQKTQNLLTNAEQTFNMQFERRNYYLHAFAETAAKDFGLKQVFEEDTRSLMVALNNHRKRIDADMAIAVNTDGMIKVQLINQVLDNGESKVKVGSEQGMPFGFMKWFELNSDNRLYQVDQGIYQLSFSPITSGDLVIGWIGFGYSVDQRFAQQFAGITGLNINLVLRGITGHASVYASSLVKINQQEQQLTNSIIAQANSSAVIASVNSIGEVNEQQLLVVMYGNRSDLLVSVQERWQELLLFAALLLIASLIGAYLIAAGISKPVTMLVEQVKAVTKGRYDQRLDFQSTDELGELAVEFNHMKEAITKRENTISYQAYHDALTGLANRNKLLITVGQWIQTEPEPFALLRINPQRLREVNYSLGHDIGDQVVQEIAHRLSNYCSKEQVYNMGGSSFALIIRNSSEEKLRLTLAHLEQILEKEYQLSSIRLNIQTKIGVALFPEHSRHVASLLTMAGAALQYAQTNGLPHVIYQPSFTSVTRERLQLYIGLKSAISEEQLVLFYQPKLDLNSGIVTSVEALVRWSHPEHGMVPPDKFISLAEQTGYIHPLTGWVIDTALQQHKRWLANNIHLPIAVNVSAENLKFPDFYEQVILALERYELTPDAIWLEITESVVVEDPQATIELLTRFRNRGFRLSIDDYGTGYSSLAQLTQLPVCEMKIDKAFITDLMENEHNRVIVNSTIKLAHALALTVVAEGIEDAETLQWLKEHQCEKAQGYFISKPKAAEEFEQWLLNSDYFQPRISLVKRHNE